MEAKFTRKSMVYRRIGMEHSANCLRRRLFRSIRSEYLDIRSMRIRFFSDFCSSDRQNGGRPVDPSDQKFYVLGSHHTDELRSARRLPPIHRQKPPLDGLPGGDRDHDDCWISLSRENATQSPRFAYLPRVRNHSSCLQNVNCFCAGPYSPKR